MAKASEMSRGQAGAGARQTWWCGPCTMEREVFTHGPQTQRRPCSSCCAGAPAAARASPWTRAPPAASPSASAPRGPRGRR